MLESHYQVMALLFLGGLRYPVRQNPNFSPCISPVTAAMFFPRSAYSIDRFLPNSIVFQMQLISAVAGAAWAVGRIFYAHGYSQEDNGKLNPEFRYRSILTPILMYPSLLALLGSTFAFGAQLLGWI
jgi:hypothetical protein